MASFAKIVRFVLTRGWYGYIQPQCAVIASLGRSADQLIGAPPPADLALGTKIALFVHYDPGGIVRDHVLHYLLALREAGFSIVFVTNSGALRADAQTAVSRLCAAVMIRRNVGYDFGAMREVIVRLGLPRDNTEQLVIANDSVYGPLRPLSDLLDRVDFAEADVWGCTESWQVRYHLQSYFLVFGERALRHPAWSAFWARVRPVQSKEWIIRNYEVGLTQMLLRAGLRCRAIWPYAELVKRVDPDWVVAREDEDEAAADPIVAMRKNHARYIRDSAVLRRPLNPTADLWRQLLLSGFPFVKRELLRSNPTNVNDVTDWRDVVRNDAGLDPTMIERDLQRSLRNVAP
jgi:lipopolysaccharide biosynthesis protein